MPGGGTPYSLSVWLTSVFRKTSKTSRYQDCQREAATNTMLCLEPRDWGNSSCQEPIEVQNEPEDRILKHLYSFPLLSPKINKNLQLLICFSFPFLKEVPGQLPEAAEKLLGFNSPELIAIHLAGLVQKAGQN